MIIVSPRRSRLASDIRLDAAAGTTENTLSHNRSHATVLRSHKGRIATGATNWINKQRIGCLTAGAVCVWSPAMSTDEKMPNKKPDRAVKKPGAPPKPTGNSKKASKEERLGQALRANLRRRKGTPTAPDPGATDNDRE